MANYLYNGVELPKLPEWDKEKYPYAWMWANGTLRMLDKRYMRCTGDSGGDCFAINGNKDYGEIVSYITFKLSSDGTSWEQTKNALTGEYEVVTEQEALFIFTTTAPLWTNYDVINADDGTVFFAASDPIPVGGEPIDPTAMLLGWLTGRKVAGMRGKWETLFEGEVYSREEVDIDPDSYLGAATIQMTYPGFAYGDTVRLTVNGESRIFTAIYACSDESMEMHPILRRDVYVGNSDIGGGPANGFENENVIDYDYCLLQYETYNGGYFPPYAGAYFYTPVEGSYSIKIESLVS